MARIAGVDLPREKRVEIGLTYVYGIGRVSAAKILEKAQVNPDTRVRELTDDEVKRISEVIDAEYMVEGDLRREVALNIKRLQELAATEESVIERDFLYVVRRPRQTQEPVKVPSVLLLTRRNKLVM